MGLFYRTLDDMARDARARSLYELDMLGDTVVDPSLFDEAPSAESAWERVLRPARERACPARRELLFEALDDRPREAVSSNRHVVRRGQQSYFSKHRSQSSAGNDFAAALKEYYKPTAIIAGLEEWLPTSTTNTIWMGPKEYADAVADLQELEDYDPPCNPEDYLDGSEDEADLRDHLQRAEESKLAAMQAYDAEIEGLKKRVDLWLAKQTYESDLACEKAGYNVTITGITPEPPCPRCDRLAAPEHVATRTEEADVPFMGTTVRMKQVVTEAKCWNCENQWEVSRK